MTETFIWVKHVHWMEQLKNSARMVTSKVDLIVSIIRDRNRNTPMDSLTPDTGVPNNKKRKCPQCEQKKKLQSKNNCWDRQFPASLNIHKRVQNIERAILMCISLKTNLETLYRKTIIKYSVYKKRITDFIRDFKLL